MYGLQDQVIECKREGAFVYFMKKMGVLEVPRKFIELYGLQDQDIECKGLCIFYEKNGGS